MGTPLLIGTPLPTVTHMQRIAHGERTEIFCTHPGTPTVPIPGFGTRMCAICARPLDIDRHTR